MKFIKFTMLFTALFLTGCGSSGPKLQNLDEVCAHLENKGFVSGPKETVAGYQLVGAINGIRYSDSKVEIYEYEGTAPEKVIFIVELVPTATNGRFSMYVPETYEAKDNLVKEFKTLNVE
ncbi:MAG: hypothetical protein HUJ60_02425 [Bacilli bacterium]|nr:hypothetical protein [Bacilli bacterium]